VYLFLLQSQKCRLKSCITHSYSTTCFPLQATVAICSKQCYVLSLGLYCTFYVGLGLLQTKAYGIRSSELPSISGTFPNVGRNKSGMVVVSRNPDLWNDGR